MTTEDYIPARIRERFEIHDFHHAAAILASEFPAEFSELCGALGSFTLSIQDIRSAGGNESASVQADTVDVPYWQLESRGRWLKAIEVLM